MSIKRHSARRSPRNICNLLTQRVVLLRDVIIVYFAYVGVLESFHYGDLATGDLKPRTASPRANLARGDALCSVPLRIGPVHNAHDATTRALSYPVGDVVVDEQTLQKLGGGDLSKHISCLQFRLE